MNIERQDQLEVSVEDCVRVMGKYREIVKHDGGLTVLCELDAVELLYLHALVRLGAAHPGFQDVGTRGKKTIERFRAFCRRSWVEHGLTMKEAVIMDSAREAVETSHE